MSQNKNDNDNNNKQQHHCGDGPIENIKFSVY